MQKIPTVFRRDPNDMRRVLPEVTEGCEWVLAGEGVATRKYDGTCTMLDAQGRWWARREVKAGREYPADYIALSTDANTGKTVGWEPIHQSAFAKFHAEALRNQREGEGGLPIWHSGTFELIGPRVNGNPENVSEHVLIRHFTAQRLISAPLDYAGLRAWLLDHEFEGIVWHHPGDGQMAKLKRRDFA